ncbi:deoxyribose-phosphate aldolase [Blastopirellula sp. J2-11]|uniref:deoxyribose-phosphate aldolase n=1 Tax=Blastopirellula sp. J2-11 TaxID=2943192 RepID=UPI0021C7A7D1|nr:deoxyribose-phosphate aldolase [Blastopirellula sp. J2-11]UUO04856.1 deoxyribose-phosphate aldolase [Blastopirellula sp. J2-11]
MDSPVNMTRAQLLARIDHTLLAPNATQHQLEDACLLGLHLKTASVCVPSFFAARCARMLVGSHVKACTVIGFPHGDQPLLAKLHEAEQCLVEGAQELDMVVNISDVKSGHWRLVRKEITQLVKMTHDARQKMKVIFENCYLSQLEKIRLCQICNEADADWVKTSTGYGTSGATLDDVRLMRRHARSPVKAAGGIRNLTALLQYCELGADRIGLSRTESILAEFDARFPSV